MIFLHNIYYDLKIETLKSKLFLLQLLIVIKKF